MTKSLIKNIHPTIEPKQVIIVDGSTCTIQTPSSSVAAPNISQTFEKMMVSQRFKMGG